MMNAVSILFLVLGILSSRCNQSIAVSDYEHSDLTSEINNKPPSRWQLYSAYRNNEVVVLYGSNDQSIRSNYVKLIENFKQSLLPEAQREVNISFREASEVTIEELKDKIVYIVGTLNAIPVLHDLKSGLPITLESDGFSVLTEKYSDRQEVLAMYNYPNPQQANLPLTIITGNDDDAIYEVFKRSLQSGMRFTWASFDLVVYNNSTRSTIGAFDNNWQIDSNLIFEFGEDAAETFETDHYTIVNFNSELSTERLITIGQTLEDKLSKIKDFIGVNKVIPHMTYYIYPSAEEKALHRSNSAQASVDYTEYTTYTVINEQYEDNYIEKENQLLLQSLLGEVKSPVLEIGLAISFTDRWQREGYQYWAARLIESGYKVPLADLFSDNQNDRKSTLLRESMSGALIDFLLTQFTKDDFLGRYSSWSPGQDELQKYEPMWQEFLKKLPSTYPQKMRKQAEFSYLQGFNFAHEGYRIFNGYLSDLASKAIYKQAQLGANAMAIVPYSYMTVTHKPNPLPIPNRPGQENDQGVIHSAYVAKQQGMSTMLKPQIWFRGSWPGDVNMKNSEDWDLFFQYYNEWIIHYALLAEIHQIDMLSVGVEFVKATLSHEEEWRQIIRNIRKVYQGKLTYSANWGDEFEKVGFWDELDFIGLNCYYPLSKQHNPSKKELRKNFNSVKNKIRSVYNTYKKPIVFTEIGFRSIDAPWKNPHAEGDDTFNEQHQDLCYQVIFEGIQDEDWCGGILWWKFPSYLDYQGIENNSFTPNMKLAEATVKDWFLHNQ
jgi:hypothetical protein